MNNRTGKSGKVNMAYIIVIMVCMLSLFFTFVYAEPIGPTITVLGNESKVLPSGTKVNSTNGTNSPGGFIFTIGITSQQQNTRWKGYVGNVTGTLVLDDASDNTLFQWTLSTVTGEIYATRASGNINWSGINCTWIVDKKNPAEGLNSNRTPEHDENIILSHTNLNDNITATFQYMNHSQLEIGSVTIGKDECFSVQTWRNDSAQSFTDSDTANFTQVILYDSAWNTTGGNVVYTTQIEDDQVGFNGNETYDFQMILPEDGRAIWTSSTAYYFYVELA